MIIPKAALLLSAALVLALTVRRRWPRFAVEPFPTPMRRALALALLMVTLALAVFAPLLSFDSGEPIDIEGVAFFELFFGHVLLVTFLFLWWGLAGFEPLRSFLHLRVDDLARELEVGGIAGAGVWAVTMTVMALVGTFLIGIDAPVAREATAEIPPVVRMIVELSPLQRVLLVLSAGVVEEAFFRSFLQARTGILVSSLLFAASHSSYGLPLMLVGVFVVSMVLGLVFAARQSVVPCMVAHAVFDAIQLFLILPAVVRATAT